MIYEDRSLAWGALMPFFRTSSLYEMQAIWESEQASIYSVSCLVAWRQMASGKYSLYFFRIIA